MSIRRLDPIQPPSFAFTADNMAWAKKTISAYPTGKQASAVIALLWRAQEQNAGWLSKPAMEYVGQMLDMAFIRVYEVATFYTMFQLSPVGRKAHVQVCGTTPCMLRGSEELMKVCKSRIHQQPHHVSDNGDFSWEEVECLGACVNAPMIQIWKDTYEDLTPESLDRILDDLEAGKPVRPGPQNGRQLSAPLGKQTSLTDESLYAGVRSFTRVEAPAAPPPNPPPNPPAPTPPVSTAPPAAPVVFVTPPAAPPKPSVTIIPKPSESAAPPIKVAQPVLSIRVRNPDGSPELLVKPRSGKGDDLKLIWGVGPALERLLQKIGIWHFDQIAAWSPAELRWIDERLDGFKGRAKRDEWIKQAKKLAKGWRPDSVVGDSPKGKR